MSKKLGEDWEKEQVSKKIFSSKQINASVALIWKIF